MILEELETILGPELLARFMVRFAGTVVNIKKSREGTSFAELATVVGVEAAERLQQHFAGQRVYIPRNAADERAHRNLEIRDRLAAGESPRSIARSYRQVVSLSERTIRRIGAGITRHDTVGRPAKPTA